MSDFIEFPGSNGYSAQEIFASGKSKFAYTYDDVIILPGAIDTPSLSNTSLETNITRGLRVKVPLLSSPMDTVTEHKMAIAMALQGAIGVIHYNMTEEEQANEIRLVKKFKNGFITDPACLSPQHTIADVDRLKDQFGYSGIPITENGKFGSKLLGIVTGRDVDYIEDRTLPLSEVMTTNLITGNLLYPINTSTFL